MDANLKPETWNAEIGLRLQPSDKSFPQQPGTPQPIEQIHLAFWPFGRVALRGGGKNWDFPLGVSLDRQALVQKR